MSWATLLYYIIIVCIDIFKGLSSVYIGAGGASSAFVYIFAYVVHIVVSLHVFVVKLYSYTHSHTHIAFIEKKTVLDVLLRICWHFSYT